MAHQQLTCSADLDSQATQQAASQAGGWLTLTVAALLAVLAMLAAGCENQPRIENKSLAIQIGSVAHKLEIAADPDSRYQGLSDRKSIPPGTGMIFVFPKPFVLEFVMRRCYVPIDILYLEPSGRVMKTYTMTVQPYDTAESDLVRYSSQWPAQFAIELAGGQVQKLGIKEGDTIQLPREELLKMAR